MHKYIERIKVENMVQMVCNQRKLKLKMFIQNMLVLNN